MYSINFTKINTKFCLSLHYNVANSYLFVNGIEINKFKAKDSKIVATALCLGNISKENDFSVDYNAIAVDDILDIHKYLTEKNNIK